MACGFDQNRGICGYVNHSQKGKSVSLQSSLPFIVRDTNSPSIGIIAIQGRDKCLGSLDNCFGMLCF